MSRASLSNEQVVTLARLQLEDLGREVERHGIELGTLLTALFSLIERHRDEGAEPGQMQADHETMLRFGGPIAVLRQFADRSRQRLDHIREALARLPQSSLPLAVPLAASEELFPLEEERTVCAAAHGVRLVPAAAPGIEVFP